MRSCRQSITGANTTSVMRVASSRRRGLAFRSRVERELFAKEEILGCECDVGRRNQRHEVQQIMDKKDGANHPCQSS